MAKWELGCIVCGGKKGKGSCKGMCNPCYCKWRKRTHPEMYSKEVRRVISPKTQWDSDSYLGLCPSSLDWARLAAFIDGEGSINLSPRRTPKMKSITFCGKVVVTNTDIRLSVWCAEKFGMKFFNHGNKSKNWKSCYFAQASGYRASWILRNCMEWFLLKREQAEVVIAHQHTTKVGTWERGSGVSTPLDLLEYRLLLKNRLAKLNKRGPASSPNPKIAKSTDTIM